MSTEDTTKFAYDRVCARFSGTVLLDVWLPQFPKINIADLLGKPPNGECRGLPLGGHIDVEEAVARRVVRT